MIAVKMPSLKSASSMNRKNQLKKGLCYHYYMTEVIPLLFVEINILYFTVDCKLCGLL